MKQTNFGNTPILLVIVVAAVSAMAYVGLNASIFDAFTQADLRLEPQQTMIEVGQTFIIDVVVESEVAVNVFAGDISFNPDVLTIQKINYNTSIADLWAELPWYHNGDGTLNFAGGTTQPGGFTGTGTLISITFKTLSEGSGGIVIESARILQHDGLGTDAVIAPSIDAIVTVNTPENTTEILSTQGPRSTYLITSTLRSTDLNGDGKQSVADLSIFMQHITTQNQRSDFNEDGKVNLGDLSILMQAK